MKSTSDESSGLAARTIGGMRWLVVSSLMTAALRIGVVAVYARLLSPADFGIMAVVGIFAEIGRFVAASGIIRTLIYKDSITKEQISTAFTVNFFSSLALTVIICLFSQYLAKIFDMSGLAVILCVGSLIFPLFAISAVSVCLLERDHKFSLIAKSDISTYVVSSVVIGIPMALAGWGAWALVVSQLVAAFHRSVLLLRAQSYRVQFYFNRRIYYDLMRKGTGFSIQRAANVVALKGDYFVVGSVLGPALLGLYERAYVLMNISNSVIGRNISSVLFPAFSRMGNDISRKRAAFKKCMTVSSIVFFPASAVCIVIAPEIVDFLLGGRWSNVVMPFQILATGMFFRNAYKVSGAVVDSTSWMYAGSFAQTVYALFVVVGAYILVGYGIVGVAASTLIAVLFVFFVLAIFACKSCNLSLLRLLIALVPGIVLGAVCSIVSMIVAFELRALHAPSIITILGVGAALGIPAGAVVALGRFKPSLFGARGREIIDSMISMRK